MTDATRKWLDEVEARCAATDPGPWSHGPPCDFSTIVRVPTKDGEEVVLRVDMESDAAPEMLDFMCAARQDIPRLLALVERLSAYIDQFDHNERCQSQCAYKPPRPCDCGWLMSRCIFSEVDE